MEGLDPSLAPEPRPGCHGWMRWGVEAPPSIPAPRACALCICALPASSRWGSACGHCSLLLLKQRGFAWEAVGGSRQTSLPACQATAAAGLAGSRLTQAAWPGTRLLARGPGGCPLLRSGSRSPATGLWPPPVPQPHPWGTLGRPGKMGSPAAGRCRGRNYRTLGRQEVWEEMRSSRREPVSLRFGDRPPLEVSLVPMPTSPSFPRHWCRRPPWLEGLLGPGPSQRNWAFGKEVCPVPTAGCPLWA